MSGFLSSSGVTPAHSTIGIIIPVYNGRQEDLVLLLDQLKLLSIDYRIFVLIIDDGSSPSVAIKDSPGVDVRVIRHSQNLGKGEALKTGFKYFSKHCRTGLILTIDADLQHPVSKIPHFIKAFERGKGELMVGYRPRRPGTMPLSRIISNTMTSLIISALTGQLIRDSQCGFRLIRTSLVENLFLTESRFHLESEMLIRLGWLGIRIGFTKIPTVYKGENSSINHVKDTLNFIHLIFRLIIERIRGHVRSFKT